MARWARVFGFLLGLIVLAGCDEDGLMPSVPDYIHSLAVPSFKNSTIQPGLDQEITQKVIREFIADGRLNIVPAEKADALLEGDIEQYAKLPLIRDANQVPEQYKLQIVLNLDFKDLKNKKLLWSTRTSLTPTATVELSASPSPVSASADANNVSPIVEFTNYWVLNNLGVTPEDESTARARVEDQIARRVVSRTLDGF